MNKNYNKTNSRSKKSSFLIIFLFIILIYLVYLLFADDSVYTIILSGDNPLYLTIGEDYIEPGYKAYNEENLDVTDNVKVKNIIDINTSGEYDVLYSIGKYEVIRKVIITNEKIKLTLSLNNEELTNEDLLVKVQVSGKFFDKIILPDGTESRDHEFDYKISTNGEYVFRAYSDDGEVYEEQIVVKNIDKKKPTGSCKAIIDVDKTEITVNAIDDNEIKEYNYLETGESIAKISDSIYTHNTKLSKNISVEVMDAALNVGEITCDIIDNTIFEPLLPKNTDNVVFKSETETLKVYVINRGSYYLTRIWVENPYEQLNKYDSPEYGKELYEPKVLLEKAISSYNLGDKLLLGFNASGFYLKDTFDASSVANYSAYNKTSVGTLVITDGRVIRNAYDKAYKTWFIMGINPDNQMVIFEDKKADTTSEITAKQQWANNVINSQIRNTYTFAAPLIQNGARVNITTSMPGGYDDYKGLQMICQINANNFALFTSSNEKRNTGIKEFLEMGCQTATNLDGGGSIALFYKEKDSNEIKKIIGGSRALPEVAYFSE